jgi:hypothetical protein
VIGTCDFASATRPAHRSLLHVSQGPLHHVYLLRTAEHRPGRVHPPGHELS